MLFEWNPNKANLNYIKHKVSFEDATQVFGDPVAISIPDIDHTKSEERWITIGHIKSNSLIVVSHTFRDRGNDEIIRIISARKATSKERRQYINIPGYKP